MTTLLMDNFLDQKFSKYFSGYHQDDMDVFLAPKGEFPDDLGKYDHIILSGSEESILNERDWILKEMDMVHNIIELGIPTLGICFGHQLIAKAILGDRGVRRTDLPEIGWKEVRVGKENSLLSKVEERFLVFNSHFDEAHNLDERFDVLATSDQCEASAFQVKDTPIWGIQFHPEIDIENGKRFIMDIKHLAPMLDLDWEIENARETGISKTLFETFYDL
jgi:GMP synthase-like glutamine amidotransferase